MHTASPPINELADMLGDAVEAANFPQNVLRYRNNDAAAQIGLETLSDDDWLSHFGAFTPLPGNLPRPLALRYHGHQFGTYNPDLGDGRGFLFAQLQDRQGRWIDLGTKGSGQTPWSRQGDGRLTLKGGVREVLASAYLGAMGAATSQTLSLIETGEQLARGDEPSPTRSALMVRQQRTHIRFGTFQRLAYLDRPEEMERLVDHCVRHYHPGAGDGGTSARTAALLARITDATAAMIGEWMAIGFVHGVMNTDNFNIAGETFDFGPYRFLPLSDPNFVAAYFDQSGLYRFGRQPTQGLWALQQLASAMTLIAEPEALSKALSGYEAAYQRRFARTTLALLGLQDGPDLRSDLQFLQAFYGWMTNTGVSWPQVYFHWFGGAASAARAAASPLATRYTEPAFAAVHHGLMARTPDRPERLDHPYFQRAFPVNLLIDSIEALWDPVAVRDDWALFHAKLDHIEEARDAFRRDPP